MNQISDPELQREFILHELEEQRTIWLESDQVERVEQAYLKLDSLLDELIEVSLSPAVEGDGA